MSLGAVGTSALLRRVARAQMTPGMTRSPQRARTTATAVSLSVVALVVLAVVVLRQVSPISLRSRPAPTTTLAPTSTCVVTSPTGQLRLDPAQAENATTIAAVAKRSGLADRAVTVAFAAALQESKLRNLAYGDLDSLGLFQQRPSQGWGMPSELLVPSYAAGAFFAALVKVRGWEAMPVGDAAQAVQRSAGPDAYGPWEHQAQVLTDALTGEVPAAFSCRFVDAAAVGDSSPLEAAMSEELGPVAPGDPLPAPQGWTVASWLIAHASTFHITSVSFMGELWTSSSGKWDPYVPVLPYLEIART